LRAFPPRGASKAFPVFIKLNATSGGKFGETFEGKYPQKEWELSSTMEQGRGRLWVIFMDLYKEIHLTPIISTPIPTLSPEEEAARLFSEGWRFWETDREIVFNNRTIGGTSSAVRGEKFVNEVFDLIGKKIENIQDALDILEKKTEELGR
jgi:hypothetical protein